MACPWKTHLALTFNFLNYIVCLLTDLSDSCILTAFDDNLTSNYADDIFSSSDSYPTSSQLLSPTVSQPSPSTVQCQPSSNCHTSVTSTHHQPSTMSAQPTQNLHTLGDSNCFTLYICLLFSPTCKVLPSLDHYRWYGELQVQVNKSIVSVHRSVFNKVNLFSHALLNGRILVIYLFSLLVYIVLYTAVLPVTVVTFLTDVSVDWPVA